MEGLWLLSRILSVQLPTRQEFSFCLFKKEVKLHADVCYGPNDLTLWPQPYVESCCHLGAIPRKTDDLNNPLSIMWWDPTSDDFESFGAGVVNGLGELSGSKLLSLQKTMHSLESRIEDHKEAFPQQNKFLLLLVRVMQLTTKQWLQNNNWHKIMTDYKIMTEGNGESYYF